MQPEEPPRNLPLLKLTRLLLMLAPGSETMFQSVSLSKFWVQLPGQGQQEQRDGVRRRVGTKHDSPSGHVHRL